MIALMTWASAHTGLPAPERLPNVVFKDACEIRLIANPQADCDAQYGARALYHAGTIILSDGWKADSLYDVSALLHELVHHLQFEAGMEMAGDNPCPGRNLEKPAYEAQFAFLEAAGVEDPIKFIGMNSMFYFFVTSCPYELGGQ